MDDDPAQAVPLGRSGVDVSPMGVGTMLWKHGSDADDQVIHDTYRTAVDGGLTLFDTAEIYNSGDSERILGECIRADGRPVRVATKFAPPSSMNPIPAKRSRVPADSPQALTEALDGSLERLGLDHVDLYQLHMPPSKNSVAAYMEAVADAVETGKVLAVGVCNLGASQIREAHGALAARGVPLATAMVGYNLLRRWPETNGVFAACEELGVSVIPYAPLAEGVLTGKYRKGHVPLSYTIALYFGHLDVTKDRTDQKSLIRRIFSLPRELGKKKMEPLFQAMETVGAAHGRSLAQVALNWLITQPRVGVIPIPGMRKPTQTADNLGAMDWAMTPDERALIEAAEEQTRA